MLPRPPDATLSPSSLPPSTLESKAEAFPGLRLAAKTALGSPGGEPARRLFPSFPPLGLKHQPRFPLRASGSLQQSPSQNTPTSEMDMSHDMSGMDMGSGNSTADSHAGMDMGGSCKISMLWNWYTTDACFLTSSWRVRGVGDYVGSLIGIFFLVVALEGIRRLSRVYDRRIRAAYYRREAVALQNAAQNTLKGDVPEPAPFRPSTKEHAVRTVLYGTTFGLSYICMLLAMYFNGGVILAIMAGGAAGYGIFGRDTGAVEGPPAQHTSGECCC